MTSPRAGLKILVKPTCVAQEALNDITEHKLQLLGGESLAAWSVSHILVTEASSTPEHRQEIDDCVMEGKV